MLDVYYLPHYPDRVSRVFVRHYGSVEEMVASMRWPRAEVRKALNGGIVLRKWAVEWCPRWLADLGSAEVAGDHPEGLEPREISAHLDVTVSSVHKAFERAITKMERRGVLRDFLRAVRCLRAIREGARVEEVPIDLAIRIRMRDNTPVCR